MFSKSKFSLKIYFDPRSSSGAEMAFKSSRPGWGYISQVFFSQVERSDIKTKAASLPKDGITISPQNGTNIIQNYS